MFLLSRSSTSSSHRSKESPTERWSCSPCAWVCAQRIHRTAVARLGLGEPNAARPTGSSRFTRGSSQNEVFEKESASRSRIGRHPVELASPDSVQRSEGLGVRESFLPYRCWGIQQRHLRPGGIKAGLGPIGWHDLRRRVGLSIRRAVCSGLPFEEVNRGSGHTERYRPRNC